MLRCGVLDLLDLRKRRDGERVLEQVRLWCDLGTYIESSVPSTPVIPPSRWVPETLAGSRRSDGEILPDFPGSRS